MRLPADSRSAARNLLRCSSRVSCAILAARASGYGTRPHPHLRMICKSNSLPSDQPPRRGAESRMLKRADQGPGADTMDSGFGWRRARGEAALSDVHRTIRVEGTSARRLAAYLGPG